MLPANRVTTTFLIQKGILELCSSQNSKSEALNTKQIQIIEIRNLNQNNLISGHLNLGFRYCLGFRILRLGFLKRIYILYD